MILNLLAGIAFGIILMIAFLLLVYREKGDYKPIPLNPELLDFWKTSIRQKEIELDLLTQIVNCLQHIAKKP